MPHNEPLPDELPQEALTLAASLLNANAELKRWKDYKDAITTRLSALHTSGTVPTKFVYSGHNVALKPGRRSLQIDAIGKGRQAALILELTIEGHVTATFGDPFWEAKAIKEPKPPRNQEQLLDEQDG